MDTHNVLQAKWVSNVNQCIKHRLQDTLLKVTLQQSMPNRLTCSPGATSKLLVWLLFCTLVSLLSQPAELKPPLFLFSHPPTLDLEELRHHGLPCVATVPLLFMVTLILKLVQSCDSSVVKPFHGVETLVPRGKSIPILTLHHGLNINHKKLLLKK